MRTPGSISRPVFLQRMAAGAALLIATSVTSGCSFNWDSGGINDIFFGGRKATDIVKAGEAPPEPNGPMDPKTSTEPDGSASLRKVAILPVAYVDASSSVPCDLCPPGLEMNPTGLSASRLATGFIYEAVVHHPRFLFPTPEVVDRAIAGTASHGMRETAAALAKAGRADWVIVAALQELRPRVGDDQHPEQSAGVKMYAALVEARSGDVIWSDTFDEDEPSRNFVYRIYDKVMNDRPVRYHTAEGYSEVAVDDLIGTLVKKIR